LQSSEYDLITGRILKEMPKKGIVHLTTIRNVIISTGYFPVQWKVAHIILIPKPGKPLEEASSYAPTSLLPVMGKIFEKDMLNGLHPILEKSNPPGPSVWISTETLYHRTSTPNYTDNKRNFRKKQYCSVASLDITQAFDKALHPRPLVQNQENPSPCILQNIEIISNG
jgi:hypothetical protein